MRSRVKSRLPEGKLPIDVLAPLLKSFPVARGNNVVVPPDVGVDVGATRVNGQYLVVSSDPITGTVENIGWHAVNVSANDVATSGIMPESLTLVSLFPGGYTYQRIRKTFQEIQRAANRLGIVIVGGHTEVTPKLKRPIIVVTCFGTGRKLVIASMARENDSILMTKVAGIEGTSILVRLAKVRRKLGKTTIRRSEKIIRKLSIIPEARAAATMAHAMHDTTEGGLLGSLVEMSLASKLGFELDAGTIPVDFCTREICNLLSIDPLKLIGSGSLIISCSPRDQNAIIKEVNRVGVRCTYIGRFVSKRSGRKLIHEDGSVTRIKEVSIQDELWPATRKYGNLS